MNNEKAMPPRLAAWSKRLVLGGTLGLSAACASLLPTGSSATMVRWSSYEEARQTIERIVPYETRREQLHDAGIDPQSNPAITILTYAEIAQRFAAGAAVRAEDLDAGVRQCLTSAKRCGGYAVNVRRTRRERIGNFWLDLLNFKRDIEITGWSFTALILMVDDQVVHTLYGGQPNIHESEVTRNPLGPLQGAADRVPIPLR